MRFDWGSDGARAIREGAHVVVWVDQLGTEAPPVGTEVTPGTLETAGELAAWALERQAELGGRFTIAVVASGVTRPDGTLRFAVEDLLAAGAVIEALSERRHRPPVPGGRGRRIRVPRPAQRHPAPHLGLGHRPRARRRGPPPALGRARARRSRPSCGGRISGQSSQPGHLRALSDCCAAQTQFSTLRIDARRVSQSSTASCDHRGLDRRFDSPSQLSAALADAAMLAWRLADGTSRVRRRDDMTE